MFLGHISLFSLGGLQSAFSSMSSSAGGLALIFDCSLFLHLVHFFAIGVAEVWAVAATLAKKRRKEEASNIIPWSLLLFQPLARRKMFPIA